MILFLGSGVSLASGLPGVSKIRTELLKFKSESRLQKLFNLLVELDTNYLNNSAPFRDNSGRYRFTGQISRLETTYEDLFYLVDQIVINGEGRRADVTVESFVDLLRRRGRSFLKGKIKIEQAVDLHKLAIDARKFIEQNVASLLYTTKVKGLDLVVELANSPLVSKLNIVTLNHDTLVEQILTKNNIEFSDGFGYHDGDIRWFEDKFSNDSKIRLVKLHGSISWWSQAGNKVIQPVIITDNSPNKWRNKKSEPIKDIRQVPSFLTGVTKVYSYNRGIFADQHYCFLQLLHNNNLIIMSGYGWGDIPISFQLQNWFARDRGNTLILLHQNPMNLANNSLELRHIYNKYTKNKQIIPIEKWLSETSLSEIKKFL